MTPSFFFQNRSQTFVSFRSYLIDAFKKKLPVNDITASCDDVITKSGDANFTVKSLLNSKLNEMLIKSHLSKTFAWNFHRILSIRWWIYYKRKKIFFKILIVFLFFSIVLKQWNNRSLIQDKQTFLRYLIRRIEAIFGSFSSLMIFRY